MALKRFPIGVQDFAILREDKKYYVDKTDLIYKLVTSDRYYFLSRPRRFGKSLLMSTLQCYFEGRKELFEGLAIEKLETEWRKYPVFKLSFAGNKFTTLNALQISLEQMFQEFEACYGIENQYGYEWGPRFIKVLKAAYEQTGMQPVVLVDEYDAPLLDSHGNAELQLTLKNEMRKLFSPLKDLGGILRFVFLTGITRFSQLSIFSELNNLKVISMLDEYSGLCGITKEELLTQMKPEIQTLADANGLDYDGACEALRYKYDGYHFSKRSADVFNPFSLINALNDLELTNYWFSTGTPTILTELIKKHEIDPEVFENGFEASLEMFDTPTETAEDPIAMLYQSGYLTIKDYKHGEFAPYILGFPNEEVATGFKKSLLVYYAGQSVGSLSVVQRVINGFRQGDLEGVMQVMRAFLSSVPYDAEKQNELHYKTLVYCVFNLATPYLVRCEEKSAAGRADVVVETADAVYVLEFKLNGNGTAEDALRQIDDKGYLIPYSATLDANGVQKKLFKVGVSFDEEKRTLGEWIVKEA